MDEVLKQRLDFIIELDRMKSIARRSLIYSGEREENDAEHSWHIAAMALVLKDYAAEPIDIDRVIKMLIVHDLIEIYAGDTFAYDVRGNLDKEAREAAAADKLYAILPDGEGGALRALWEEFDSMATPDSRFASALDRLQPLIANRLTDGHTWQGGNVSREQVYKRIEPLKTAAPKLWDYANGVAQWGINRGLLK